MANTLVGEHPSRRKKRLRRLSAIGGMRKHEERARWLGEHQNNNPHTRPQPSLPAITMRVVDWDVRPRRG